MQKVGHKSIVVKVEIPNYNNPLEPFKVRVQANKNHGICDVTLCKEVIKEFPGKKRRIYLNPVQRLSEVVSNFQGRQYDNPIVMERLSNVLTELLNK